MSFLDEAQSISSKLNLRRLHPLKIIGLLFVVCLVVVVVLQGVLGVLQNGGALSSEESSVVTSESQSEEEVDQQAVFVHVGGAVNSPGLYELPADSRIKDAIDAAGGMKENAQIDSVNLAQVLVDGDQIVVAENALSNSNQANSEKSNESGASPGASTKININTASAEQLMELDGVGEATAAKIIDHRSNQGRFKKPEDIMNVSGIGEKKYDAIKDKICV